MKEEKIDTNFKYSEKIFLNQKLYQEVKKEADEKFKDLNDQSVSKYVYILREYKQQGGKVALKVNISTPNQVQKSLEQKRKRLKDIKI